MKSYCIALLLALIFPLAACSSKEETVSEETSPATTEDSSAPASEPTEEKTASESATKAIEDWYTYTAGDNSYEVKFPGEPQEEQQENFIGAGYEGDEVAYTAISADVSEAEGLSEQEGEDILNAFIEGAVGSNQIAQEKDISKGSYSGREVTINSDNGAFYKLQIFFDQEELRLFQVGIAANEESKLNSPEADAFFESFTISP